MTNNYETVIPLDSTYAPAKQLLSFADTNALLELSDQNQQSFLQFWTTSEPTVILGLNDKRLPDLTAGLQAVIAQDYHYFLRNSGGLAVISDPGILNVSYFLPGQGQQLNTSEAYEIMKLLIASALPELAIQNYEIKHSYCPGSYDLSVNGKKIAGIAQRRHKDAIALMIYISINGDQNHRGQVIRQFYDHGKADYQVDDFPLVHADSMTTLAALNPKLADINLIKQRILGVLDLTTANIDHSVMKTASYQAIQQKALKNMQRRNEVLPTLKEVK